MRNVMYDCVRTIILYAVMYKLYTIMLFGSLEYLKYIPLPPLKYCKYSKMVHGIYST